MKYAIGLLAGLIIGAGLSAVAAPFSGQAASLEHLYWSCMAALKEQEN